MPIQQHCLPGAAFYNTPENPHCCFLQEASQYYNKPFHIIWLSLTVHGNAFNHICSLLPWKCGAMDFCIVYFGVASTVTTKHVLKWSSASRAMNGTIVLVWTSLLKKVKIARLWIVDVHCFSRCAVVTCEYLSCSWFPGLILLMF